MRDSARNQRTDQPNNRRDRYYPNGRHYRRASSPSCSWSNPYSDNHRRSRSPMSYRQDNSKRHLEQKAASPMNSKKSEKPMVTEVGLCNLLSKNNKPTLPEITFTLTSHNNKFSIVEQIPELLPPQTGQNQHCRVSSRDHTFSNIDENTLPNTNFPVPVAINGQPNDNNPNNEQTLNVSKLNNQINTPDQKKIVSSPATDRTVIVAKQQKDGVTNFVHTRLQDSEKMINPSPKKAPQKNKALNFNLSSSNVTNSTAHLGRNVQADNFLPGSRLGSSKFGERSANPSVTGQNKVLQQEDTIVQKEQTNSILGTLSCYKCSKWMNTIEVKSCHCRFSCVVCCQSVNTCSECNMAFIEDQRVSNFHMRVASLVDHPCHHPGCSYIVQPGDPHEATCEYSPFECFKCHNWVPIIEAKKHFETQHPREVLAEKNCDVKWTDFTPVPGTRRSEICCFTNGHFIWLTLNKLDNCDEESKVQFIIHSHVLSQSKSMTNDNPNITIKFDFNIKIHYISTHSSKINNNVGFIDVPLKVVQDWQEGASTLEITVVVRQKRKAEENETKNGRKKKIPRRRYGRVLLGKFHSWNQELGCFINS